MYFDDSELLKAPVKELSNAGLLWRYDLFQMNFDITNIEDKQFEEFYRYPRPGRSIALTVKYSF
jgi:outer membrane cobalamin receptor